ncbi:unnamed protein product [Ectocarpus sp. CCAP 1310/34]|nr:unnamed protein product [Ectocarpus sp. CCAP 1310/34]
MRTNEVWHVRHGERCDEVRGDERRAWENSPRCKAGGWFDPFLTSYGHVQACRAGEHLQGMPFNRQQKQPGSFDVVYTSPLVRAVQTAVCISQSLGNLPLQVVPGLCSCTAALRHIGYSSAEAILLTDEDIIEAFPGITIVPRDPLAPTSFGGAASWLVAKACEKKGAGSDGDGECFSRVLAVGHREGTRAMAGRKVPTPHCCIGIFKVNAPEKKLCTYEIHDLLSNTGKSLKPKGGSPYARPTSTMMEEESRPRNDDEDGGGEVEALAARVAALTVNTKGPKPWAKNHHGAREDAQRRASTGRGANSRENRGARQEDQDGRSSSRPTGLMRRLRGTSKSLLSAAGTSKQPIAGRSTASGPQAGRGTTTVPKVLTHKSSRRSTSKGTAVDVVGGGKGGGAASGGGERRTELPPRRTPDSGSLKVSSTTTVKGDLVSGGPVSAAGGGKNVAPREGSLAGRGFRVAVRRSSRRHAVGGGSTFAGFLGVPVDVLCGSSGVLSFLSPAELCTAQAICTSTAPATMNDCLWGELYARLPEGLKNRSKGILPHGGESEKSPEKAAAHVHPKVLFASAVSIASSMHAAKIAKKVATVKSRVGVIYNLRVSVVAMRGDISVTVNGKSVDVMQTTGAKTEAWVSRPNVVSEPSVNHNGVRTFSLSSSAKIDVPTSLETVKDLRSMCVALSWPGNDAPLLPRIAVARIDERPVLSPARALGKSTDSAIVLYDITGSSSSSSSSSERGGGHTCTTKTAPSSPVRRGCALLGVLPAGSHGGQRGSGMDDGGVAFLTVHFPHELLLDVATHGRRKATERNAPNSGSRTRGRYFGDDSAGPSHGLEGFATALGLRTAGVPLWEKASTAVDGRVCPPRNVTPQLQQSTVGEDPGAAVVCIDILHPGANNAASFGGGAAAVSDPDRTLSSGPGMPYSTPGGLSGTVADVLLADFTLYDPDGASLWAFTLPIVFAACPAEGSAPNPGGSRSREDNDDTIDMAHRELREERRRGIVAESGVGRVIVELALVESPAERDEHDVVRSSQKRSCPAGHMWVVRSARVELELGFVNMWFGTKHGSP